MNSDMYKVIDKGFIIEFSKIFLLGCLIVICTFPSNEWTYSVGIDPPLFWVYNHLFDTDLTIGKHIIFPHGPLAFLMYPMPENIVLATVLESILKILLVFNLFSLLSKHTDQTKWLLTFFCAYYIAIIEGFNHLLLANIILLYCIHHYLIRFLLFFILSIPNIKT